MNGRIPSSRRVGHRLRVILQLIAVLAVALPAVDGTVGVGVQRASADPAPASSAVTQNTAGALTAGTVPDGTCFATVSASGGGGASSSTGGAITGGQGGAGATIGATFRVVPGQSYGGTVGAGAPKPTSGAGATAPGGAGDGSGGAGGTIVNDHRGGGGGGGTSVSFAGTNVLLAGGGGGGGAAHQNNPAGLGGGAGFTGIGAGVVATGTTGSTGVDNPNTITVGGGQGGQTAAGGTGGTNSSSGTLNGATGTGVGTGNGGNGGPDADYDSGGGGGGGASWIRGTSVDAASTAPSAVTGAAGTATASGSVAGATGSITITWVPCNYDLALTKTVSSPNVNAGNKVTWTLTVKNNGPYPMTKGDTIDLADTLPAGPNGTPTPAYKVTGFTDTPGTSGGLASGALTCAGVTVGSSMPATTNCSRAYSAPSAVGAPSGGVRGLDVNEQITITYEQIISNTAPCATITNTATIKDRPAGSIVTDTANTPLTINCYDLAITKTVNAPDVTQNGTITWTIAVTNNGPAGMAGPVDTTANPLVITDNFPSAGLGSVTAGTQTGTAGPCARAASTITCTNGLASGATETLLYTETVNNGTANGTVVNNTATVTDPKTGDANDSSTATTTVKNPPTITVKKTVSSRANAADQFTVALLNGASTLASATTSGAGLSATTAATSTTAGTTYTLTDAMAAGSVSVLGQYTKSITCTNSTAGSATSLPSGAGSSFPLTPANGDVITCTFTNGPTAPTITFGKSISSRFVAADQFTVQIKNGAAVTASATTAGAGTTASTAATAVTAGTSYTLTEIKAAGAGLLSDYASSISCTNGTSGTGTVLPSGTGQSFTVTPSAGDTIGCTLTNAAKPHLTLVKSVASRAAAADQFTVAIAHGATTDASASTSGAGVSATTGGQALTAGTTYTLTDAMAAGSTSTLADYVSSISCTNATGGSSTTLPSGSGTSFSLTPAAADSITCTITNTARPHVTLVKSVGGRINAADQFTVAIKNGASTVASASTSGAGVSATTGSQALTAGTTYTLTDVMAAGSSSVIGNYSSSIACSNATGGSSTTLPSGSGTSFSLTPANSDAITCTITNTPPAPKLTLVKSVASRVAGADQFTVKIAHGATTDATATTSGAGVSATTGSTTLTAGTAYTLTDAMAAGSTSTLTDYSPAITCTNATTSSGTTLPSGAGSSFSLTPAGGDVITCTITNVARPHVTLVKSVASRVSASDQFVVAITHGATTDATGTTSGAGVSATTGSTTLTAGTAYTLTDAMTGGSPSALSDYLSSIACTNATGGSSTTLPSGSGTSFALTPTAADNITCTVTNTAKPHLTLLKTVGGRINAADQFTVAIKNGASTVASASTSGAGVSATTGSQALTAGTTYTLTDVMAGGSSSVIGNYASSIACSNTAGGSSTTLPSGSGASFSVTPANGDNITCTITNTPPAPRVTLSKSVASRVAGADQFTVTIAHGVTSDASASTSGAGTTASTGQQTLAAGTTYTLNDLMAAGSPSTIADYSAAISCSNSTTSSGTTLPSGAGTSFTMTPAGGDVVACTITNTAKPHLTLVKSVASRANAADQFTVNIKNGASTVATVSTSGAGTSATTGSQALTAGTTYTLNDLMAAGSFSTLSDYLSSVSCTNATGGSSTTLPTGSGTSFSVTPAAADAITCTITNTAKPHLTLVKSVASRANAADQFTVNIKNGASTVATVSTSGAGTSATTGVQTLTAGTAYTLNDLMAAGSPSSLGQYASGIACTNSASGSGTTLPSGAGTSFGITPANGDVVTCTITNTAGSASLGLTKSASPNTNVAVGNVITYTYGVTNTGNLPLTNVAVTDPHTGLSAITCTPVQGSTLAAAATMSCSATYTVTQADVDAGSILNTGTVTGKDPSNTTVSKTAGATVTAAQSASVTLTKSASPNTSVVTGNVVTYTFHGTNTGTLTLHNVTVTDPMTGLSALSCTPGTPATLAPNAVIDCTATYTVTQANVDAGSFSNTATINGLDPANNPVSNTGSTTVNTLRIGSATLTKNALPSSGVVAGDIVTYSLHGQNTGTVTLHNVTIADPLGGLSALNCTPGTPATLAPNAIIDCTATYTVTQADVDAGSIANTATLTGLEPTNAVVQANGSKTVTANQVSSVALTKAAAPNSGVVAGNIVTYTFGVTNTGTVTLHNVGVTDPIAGLSAIGCSPVAPATLAPGATMSCTATRSVTQADVDAGSIHNTATVNALNPANAPVTDTASATVIALQVPSLSATKAANPTSGVVAGDVVAYTVTGTNNGTVTLTNVHVTDPLPGLGAFSCTPTAPTALAPGQTIVCTASYSVTQADVDAGSIHNTATVAGSFGATPVSASDSATVTALQNPAISIVKTASPVGDVRRNDVVTYTMAVRNTGTVTLHGISVTDPKTGLSAIGCVPTAPATLAPNATMTCTATYTVTQADVDAGHIDNTATVSGAAPDNAPVTDSDSATVSTHQAPAIALVKTASPSSGVVAGDVVTYTFTGTNSGDVTLHGVHVTDPMSGLSAITCTPSAPATLAPAGTIVCHATYTVTQADVDAGSIANTATIAGLDTNNAPVTATGGTTVTALQVGTLALTKTALPASGVVAGDVVNYSFHGQNTGTVTLHAVTVTDPLTGLSTLTCTPTTPASLAPNATIDCTATYTVTQADVDAGSIHNTATIAGLTPANAPVTQADSATVTAHQVSAVHLSKVASPSSNVNVGDTVTYTFGVTNTGTVTLHNVAVTDPMTALSAITCTPAAPATLAPAATMGCTATYTVTQADVDNGTIANTATVAGLNPANAPVTDTASATVTANQVQDLTATKSASPNSGVIAGDVVTYTITGHNAGTVTLSNVTATDPMPGLSAITCTPIAPATLAPGADIVCTTTYTVTQADVDAGSIVNTATVHGTFQGNTQDVPAGTTVTANQQPQLAVTKTASPNSGVHVGDTVTYTVLTTNTGTVTVHAISVTDPMPGLSAFSCTPVAPATLAPNAAMTCTATYTVTQADMDAGSFDNTATAAGLDPNGAPVSASDSATVTTAQTPAIALTKTATPNHGVVAGNVVTYSFQGTNTGDVTLHGVTVTDPMAGLSALTCTPTTPATLAPNATVDCSATYTVTQADVDAGSIANAATVTGLDPGNGPVTATASAAVSADQSPALTLTKTASPTSGVVAGDVVTYLLHGTNTGTVTLHGVTVTDPMAGLSAITCTPTTPATLAPNATVDCSATYTVTQADVDAGSIVNTATISGLDPGNATVTDSAGATVNADQSASMSLTKTATPNSGVVAGDIVTYTFHGTNTGVVTLHNVDVTDPMAGLSAITCTPTTPATLAPNATIDCSATYTVTQPDVDAGSFSNTAAINGLDPTDNPVSTTGSTTVTTGGAPAISLTKTANPSSGVVAGDNVHYTLTATNTGTVTLHGVTVTDPMTGLSAVTCTPVAPATLAPNAVMACGADYTVTQADVNAGSFSNTATATGLDPADAPVSTTAGATVTANQAAGLSFTKTASPTSGVVAGDVVTYTFQSTNTGTVSLHGVTVTDPMTGLSAITCTPAAPATLAPNTTIDCSATYTVTQADVDAGSISNTATISGLDPGSQPVTQTAGATVTADQTASISLTKTASPTSGLQLGDTVTYTMTATNTGAVSLHNVSISDPMTGLSALGCTPTTPATLASGASVTCTATYTVTQADMDAGTISNTATVDALDPADTPVTDSASRTVLTGAAASLGLVKTATPTSGVHVGDVVTYDFAVVNNGGLTVHGVGITDPMTGLSAITCTPAAPAALAPGATMDCSATYTVTQADVDAGTITNTATVAGLDPADNPVTATDSATVTTAPTGTPDASLSKKLQGVSGTTATWIITVANSGTAPLPGPFTVKDTLPQALTYLSATGAGWDCTGTSVISCTHAADLAAGSSSSITVATTITGSGKITNVASLDVLGESITSNASVTPTPPTGGFAFTGAEISRYGLMGLLLVVGGWLLLGVARKRREDAVTGS